MIFKIQKYVMIRFDIRLLVLYRSIIMIHRKIEKIFAIAFIALPINIDHI